MMGRATLAFSGTRLLALQFRRLFISTGLEVIPQVYGLSPEESSALLAEMCRTSPTHIWRYYNLLDEIRRNKKNLEAVLNHEKGLDHHHSEADDDALSALTAELVRES